MVILVINPETEILTEWILLCFKMEVVPRKTRKFNIEARRIKKVELTQTLLMEINFLKSAIQPRVIEAYGCQRNRIIYFLLEN